jgi:CDP-diacylglycerol--inositol 3-phosphatidyltransferase
LVGFSASFLFQRAKKDFSQTKKTRKPPKLSTPFHSFVCDELDGRFARLLGQSSNFGAVLDMVTDRLATACLLALLCVLYPSRATIPLFLLALDISSHWAQVAATAAAGSTSHKEEGAASTSAIVRAYYSNRLFMGACCVSCEVLYLALYSLRGWKDKGAGSGRPPRVPLPGFLGGAVAGVVNGVAGIVESVASSSNNGKIDLNSLGGRRFLFSPPQQLKTPWSPPDHFPLALLFALVSLPGFAIKQAINWRQMRTAFGQLARHDVEESRKKKRG